MSSTSATSERPQTLNSIQISLTFFSMSEPLFVEELPGGVGIPDPHSLCSEFLGVGGACDEPEQLLQDALPEDTLGGQQRQRTWLKHISYHQTSSISHTWVGYKIVGAAPTTSLFST